MKESLHSRHNSTVLPRLGTNRKESLRNLHTHTRWIRLLCYWFQRQQPTSGGTVRSSRPANCCQHIPSNCFLYGFPDPSQFSAAKLTHYSSKPQLPSDSSRSWQGILLSGDVHPNPGPTTKYPCPVCARNVTGRGVSYLCNRCSGWVHSKCSGLQNAAEYRPIKDWVVALAIPQPLYRNYNRHQFQHKLWMGIHSPSCNSTQMTSGTN